MRIFKSVAILAIGTIGLAACGETDGASSGARDYVRVVGSSTLYSFATTVAEATTKKYGGKSPVVESTGTGGGMKLFCAGIGARHPDIVNASRRMKLSEYQECAKNGVEDVVEIQVGLDGITFAQAITAPGISLTPTEVYRALAANPFGQPNKTKLWNDVNPKLPAIPILVYGPPSTSGTRDALTELILAEGCTADPRMAALAETDKEAQKRICTEVREDGAYVDAGENDNLIIQKIAQNPKAIGIFGFSYLEENPDTLKGIPMSGVEPSYEAVSDFSYPGARPLYIYVKVAHVQVVRGLADYVREWTANFAPDGILKTRGMVVSPADVRATNISVAENMTPLDPAVLR